MTAQRIGDYNFFVPNCSLPADLEDLLANIPEECPMVDFLVGSHVTRVLGKMIQIVPRNLTDFLIEPAVLSADGKSTAGLVFRLPDDVVRLLALWERDPNRPNYSWQKFWKDYRRDLSGLGAHLTNDWVKKTLIDGVQAQVQTDIRLGFDQIGFAPKTMRRLLSFLRSTGMDIPKTVKDGVWLLNQRYPVASPDGARWTQLVLLPDAQEGLMFVNPEAWNDLQGGDSDGDGGYAGAMGEAKIDPVDPVGAFPGLVMDVDDDEEEIHEAR